MAVFLADACGRCVGRAAAAIVLCALLFAPVFAAEDEASAPDSPGIPPGQEELLGTMLGVGATLPGDCKLASAEVQYAIVNATYSCPGGGAVFQLVHPSMAPATAIQTASFAITLQSGSPPRSLTDKLVSLLRSREDSFEWTWPDSEDDDATEDDVGDEE